MSLGKMWSWSANYRSTKVESCSGETFVKTTLEHVCVCVPHDCCKKMDVIARLPGSDGRAADAVSPCTRVKLDLIPKSECPDVWIRLPRHKWPKSRENEDPVVHLERNVYGHPLAGLLWERQFEEVLLGLGWGGKYQIGNLFQTKRIIFVGVRG